MSERTINFVNGLFEHWHEAEEIPVMIADMVGVYSYYSTLDLYFPIIDINVNRKLRFDGLFLNGDGLVDTTADNSFIALSLSGKSELPKQKSSSAGYCLTEAYYDLVELDERFPSLIPLIENLPESLDDALSELGNQSIRNHIHKARVTAEKLRKTLDLGDKLCLRTSQLSALEEKLQSNEVVRVLPDMLTRIRCTSEDRFIVSGVGIRFEDMKIGQATSVKANIGDFIWVMQGRDYQRLNSAGFAVRAETTAEERETNVALLSRALKEDVETLIIRPSDFEKRFGMNEFNLSSTIAQDLRYGLSGGSVNWVFNIKLLERAEERFRSLARAISDNKPLTIAVAKH